MEDSIFFQAKRKHRFFYVARKPEITKDFLLQLLQSVELETPSFL